MPHVKAVTGASSRTSQLCTAALTLLLRTPSPSPAVENRIELMKAQMKGLKTSITKSFSVAFLKIPKVRAELLPHTTLRRSCACPISPLTRPVLLVQVVKDLRVSEYREKLTLGGMETAHSATVAKLLEPIAPPPSTTRKR